LEAGWFSRETGSACTAGLTVLLIEFTNTVSKMCSCEEVVSIRTGAAIVFFWLETCCWENADIEHKLNPMINKNRFMIYPALI
jgi:hypothetical protein